jgi:hypothetical protein
MAIEWLVTSPNPRFYNGGWDGGKHGWKLHAVVDPKFDLPPSVWTPNDGNRSRTKALCGLVPRHGWGTDLFIEDECERCAAIAERLDAATQPTERK